MLRRVMTAVTLVSFAMLCLLLLTTTPSGSGPLGILGLFAFMYLTALGALTFLFHGASFFMTRVMTAMTGRQRGEGVAFRKAYYYASVAALAPVMLIAMQSVGQVGFYQVVLVVFFVVVAWIYIAKRTI